MFLGQGVRKSMSNAMEPLRDLESEGPGVAP